MRISGCCAAAGPRTAATPAAPSSANCQRFMRSSAVILFDRTIARQRCGAQTSDAIFHSAAPDRSAIMSVPAAARAARRKTTRKRMGLRQPDRIRLGGGSAFFNDRLDAALELVEKGDIDVLMIETLAERTLALLHAAKRAGGSGYRSEER